MIENRIIWQKTLFSKEIEGGYSEPRAGDPNPTMHGITLKTLQKVRSPRETTVEDLKRLTLDEAKVIASTEYWSPIQGDRLSGGVDLAVADCSFNSGPHQATLLLQDCLGFTGRDRDGFLGVMTLQAVQARSPRGLILDYKAARLQFMQGLENGRLWSENGKGWTRRVDAITELALTLAPIEAPTTVARKDGLMTKIVAGIAGMGTAVPLIVESLPSAKNTYGQVSSALSPLQEIAPWASTVVQALSAMAMIAIIWLFVRNRNMAHNAKVSGSEATVVAAPRSAQEALSS